MDQAMNPVTSEQYPRLREAIRVVLLDAGLPMPDAHFSTTTPPEQLKEWEGLIASLTLEEFELFTVGEATDREIVFAAKVPGSWVDLSKWLDDFYDDKWS